MPSQNFRDYRNTAKGMLLELARVPGEVALIIGTAEAMNGAPYGIPLALAGTAEVGVVMHYDMKAYDQYLASHPTQVQPCKKPAAFEELEAWLNGPVGV